MKLIELSEALSKKLIARHWKVVTAESCTGGGLSYWITAIDGSSNWFDRGYITYSNESKCDLLGIEHLTIEKHGAVSEVVALKMARGALAHSDAQLSISITGIAGPTGGTPEKPIGTVWIGIVGEDFDPQTTHYEFKGSRIEIREQAILNAFTLALDIL